MSRKLVRLATSVLVIALVAAGPAGAQAPRRSRSPTADGSAGGRRINLHPRASE
jgi:hypothetical protein